MANVVVEKNNFNMMCKFALCGKPAKHAIKQDRLPPKIVMCDECMQNITDTIPDEFIKKAIDKRPEILGEAVTKGMTIDDPATMDLLMDAIIGDRELLDRFLGKIKAVYPEVDGADSVQKQNEIEGLAELLTGGEKLYSTSEDPKLAQELKAQFTQELKAQIASCSDCEMKFNPKSKDPCKKCRAEQIDTGKYPNYKFKDWGKK